MIIPSQFIRQLCIGQTRPMIQPFSERSVDPATGTSWGLSSAGYDVRIDQDINLVKGDFILASTIEFVDIPNNIMVFVKDKSSLVRRGLTVQNTVLEPGWRGHTTLELVMHGPTSIMLARGSPIAQFVFVALAEDTDAPYSGKYQNQQSGAQPWRRENT